MVLEINKLSISLLAKRLTENKTPNKDKTTFPLILFSCLFKKQI